MDTTDREDGPTDETAPTAASPATTEPVSGQPVAPPPGTPFARYTILGEIGRGGMGLVCKAYDPSLDRVIALKLLREHASERQRERMLREAQALAQVSHPNVIAIHEVGRFEGQVYLAMEFVPGITLGQRLRQDPAPRAAEVLRLFCAAGEGLAAAHAARLVHRDFKPANVVIADDGRVRVLDFGLARGVLDETSESGHGRAASSSDSASRSSLLDSPVTALGALVGTPRYMAPEQLEQQPVGPATDQFSFCIALWEALTGEHPFGAGQRRYQRIRQGQIVPGKGAARLPRHLRRALERGLRVDPEDRWPSMAVLLSELRRDPQARLRRSLLLAVPVGIALAAVGVAVQRATPAPCTDGPAHLAGVWDAQVAERVRSAFVATGWRGASAAYERVATALDAHAATWAGGYGDACRATRVAGSQSEEMLDRRMACLQRRLSELRATTELLTTADRGLATDADNLVGALGDIATCSDLEALAGGAALPSDPAVREQVADIYTEIDRADVLRAASRMADARALATAALERAQATHHPPVIAEAALSTSAASGVDGDGVAARQAAEQALRAAGHADDDLLYARALLQLATVHAAYLNAPDRTLDLQPVTAAAIDKAGAPARLRGRLHGLVAEALDSLGRFREAVAAGQQALAVAIEDAGPASLAVATATRRLAALQRTAGNYEEARALAAEAVARHEHILGADHPGLYVVLLDAASTESSAGDLALSERYLRRALALVEAISTDHYSLAMGYQRLGANLTRQGRWNEAEAALTRAAALAGAHNPPKAMQLADIYAWLGDVVKEARGLAAARPHYARVRDYYHQAGRTDDPFLGESLAIWAEAECKEGDVDRAAALFDEARAILSPRRDAWRYKLMISEAGCLVSTGRARAALPLAREAATALDATDNIADRADAHYVLARALLATGARGAALEHGRRAAEILADTGRKRADEIRSWLARAGAD